MSTQSHTHQTATWRPDARLRSRVDVCTSNVFAGRINGNYGMSPSPLLQALAIAERTKTIKIGTGVLVLPVWQPLRLAEEVAVLDNLTGGRFICGIGRGYQSHEFGRFGVTGDDSRARFNECRHSSNEIVPGKGNLIEQVEGVVERRCGVRLTHQMRVHQP